MTRYGLYIDVSSCIGCYGCVVACKNWNKIMAGVVGRKSLVDLTEGEYPDIARWVFPISCMQCDDAPCVAVCPTGASYRRGDGIITIDSGRCIGCGKCVDACPYTARYLNPHIHKADGCDLCSQRVDSGSIPCCVKSCSGEAMVFGDIDDPESKISRYIKDTKAEPLSPQLGTKPKVFYANLRLQKTLGIGAIKKA